MIAKRLVKMIWLWFVPILIGLVLFGLMIWRLADGLADRRAWNRLSALGKAKERPFNAGMVAGLPEPAQRYFNYTIQPGTPLTTAVEIEMTGELGLGTKSDPGYRGMAARQILVPPHGFVWRCRSGPLSGSDGTLPETSWTRFWVFGLLPVVRAGGVDHHRSSIGRMIAEAAFWAPASLLPGRHVRWEPVNGSTARAVMTTDSHTQAVEIMVDAAGAPRQVAIQRWSKENPEGVYREQPFGGFLSGFQTFDGYRLPTRVEGGNHLGTPEYFPFFKATVTNIQFPGLENR